MIKNKELDDKISFVSFIIPKFASDYKMDTMEAWIIWTNVGGHYIPIIHTGAIRDTPLRNMERSLTVKLFQTDCVCYTQNAGLP